MTQKEIARISRIFQQLGVESRLNIVLLLDKFKTMPVKAICEALPYEQPNISIQLASLAKYGLLSVRKQGSKRFYKIKDNPFLLKILEVIKNNKLYKRS